MKVASDANDDTAVVRDFNCVLCLLVVWFILTSSTRVLVRKTPETAHKPLDLEESIKELSKISRSLRGSDTGEVDSVGILSKVKDVAKLYLSNIQVIQGHIQDGNNEKAAAALKATVGNKYGLTESDKLAKVNSDLGLSQSPDSVASASKDPLSMVHDIPDAQVAQFIPHDVMDELAGTIHDLVAMLEGIDTDLFPSANEEEMQEQQARPKQGFDFETDAGFNGGEHHHFRHHFEHPRDYVQSNEQVGPHAFFNVLNQHKPGMLNSRVHSSMSKLNMFGSLFNDDIIMAKHAARQQALGEDVCPQTCDPDNAACHCENLFNCVANLTEYDLVVLIAGGFIETAPSSDNFGNFTLSAENLHLFDADEGVKDKLLRIKAAATDPTDMNQCKAVLSELFTACDDVTCKDPNTETFQVSSERVCAAVKTPTKLLFEVIGEEFDGFSDESEAGTFRTT